MMKDTLRAQLEEAVEQYARLFAAQKMKLVNDPLGERLPDELWTQEVKNARLFLNLE